MSPDNDFEHALKNSLAIVLGYTDLLLDEFGPGDHRRADLLEIQKAANNAVALLERRHASAR